MYEDKIIKGGEITSQGVFKSNGGAFYIFITPKTEDASSSSVLNVKLSGNTELTDFPFVSYIWNPVLVNEVNIKSSDLSNYRIFWGETL